MLWMFMGCWPDVESARGETLLSSLLRGCIKEKMEDVREPRCTGCPDLTAFYWRSEGGKLDIVRVSWIRCDVAAAWCTSALSCAVSLSVRFFPVYPAERCVLNGKVTLVLNGVSVIV